MPLNAWKLPKRNANALTGSEFMNKVKDLPLNDREEAIFAQIAEGNMPSSLISPTVIEDTLYDCNGRAHLVKMEILPDFLAIGNDSDFVRIPMIPATAQHIAKLFDASLPTRKISDIIHRHSVVKMNPHPMTPDSTMTTIPVFNRHNSIIEEERLTYGKPQGAIIAGHKKDIVITNRIADNDTRLYIYGWHYPDGKAIQPLSAAHGSRYVDYSHGVRLISNRIIIDGKRFTIKEVLSSPLLYTILSDEAAPMIIQEYPVSAK